MKRIWILALSLVLVLWVANWLYYIKYPGNTIGQFGDVFGAVNALFSGLAFAGIIISIRMQSSELKLQREELQLQRTELEETRKVFVQQSNIMEDQRNDATFFNLLANHRQMIDSLRTSKPKSIGGAFGKKHGTISEPVSGYEVVDNIANRWTEYFIEYSKMFREREVLEFENISPNPIDVLASNADLITIFKEILNVSDFVSSRFAEHPQMKFYKDTLWANLSYSEKFIFESYLFNFPTEQKGRDHKTDIYEGYDFIDFNKFSIPEIRIRMNNTRRGEPTITIIHNCKITRAIFFSYAVSYDNNSAQLMLRSEIKLQDSHLPLQIPIDEQVINVNHEITNIPYHDAINLARCEYGFFCELKHENETFRLCFEVNLTSNCNQTTENKKECRPALNGNGIQKISDDFRTQLYAQLN